MSQIKGIKRIRLDLLLFNLIILLWLTLLAILFGNQNIELMQFVLACCVLLCVIAGYTFGLITGLSISFISILSFGVYLYYRMQVVGAVLEFRADYIAWIIAVPTSALLASSLNKVIHRALKYANKYDHLENLSTIDRPTGLLSHNGILQKLEEEVERAKRFSNEVSLILVVVRHLPEMRNVYGKRGIREIYKATAIAIAQHTRLIDSKGILSEDTIAIVLPGIALADLGKVEERLRRQLQDINFLINGERKNIELKVSIGKSELIPSEGAREFLNKAKVNSKYDMG